MILFVFEGDDREPHIYKTIEKLFFPKKNDNIICSFGNNIYDLYCKMKGLGDDVDIVSMLRQLLSARGDTVLDGVKSSEISEIYLFFDYDFQNSQLSVDEMNKRVSVMLDMFADETENGKLYINYPMIESICYTKELPDDAYCSYLVSRDDCRDFKRMAREFSFYGSFDHILFKDGEKPSREKYTKIRDNWEYLKRMNVFKANYIVNGKNEKPENKDNIRQSSIFNAQRDRYVVASGCVSVLNAFPIFIYDYLK